MHKGTWQRVKIFLIDSSFFCWAMDYGFPFCTDEIELFAPLAKELHEDSFVIQFGRLNLLPAKKDFDFETCENAIVEATEWTPEAVTIMKNFSKFATKAEFITTGPLNGIWYGDLEFTNASSRKFSLGAKLIEKELALKAEKKAKITTKSFWAGITKSDICETIKFELPDVFEHQSRKTVQSITAAPIKSEAEETISCSNLRKASEPTSITKVSSSPKPVTSSQINNSLQNSSLSSVADVSKRDCQSPEQFKNSSSIGRTDVSLPSKSDTPASKSNFRSIFCSVRTSSPVVKQATPSPNKSFLEVVAAQKRLMSSKDIYRIFVHGEFLRKPLEYLQEAAFSQEVHENLHKLNFKTIFRTQSHSWPNILDGRSTIIVNGPDSGKTFSYLPGEWHLKLTLTI